MKNPLAVLLVAAAWVLPASSVFAADHADTPFLASIGRPDARITDSYAFTRGDNLVLAVGMNPAIPNSATSYMFPSDLQLDISVDVSSAVSASDPNNIGGTVLDPSGISADLRYRVTFGEDGSPTVHTIPGTGPAPSNVFVGLRDDPFIRAPRTGRNVAAIVIEVPLAEVVQSQSTILVWASANLDAEDQVEVAGLALRSMFPENVCLNNHQPKHHASACGLAPDVMIFNTAYAAAYPNGRDLPDDVVDLVGDSRVLSNDAPFPSENDVPFLEHFPYLAPPQP